MTLHAWRPLKDAPTTGIVTVKTPIYGLVIAYYEPQDEYAEYYLSIRGPNSSYDLIYEDAANTYRAAGLRTFARTIHIAMGGRIPDEVP